MSADSTLPPLAVVPAQPQWLDDGTPYSQMFADVYYSRDDGLAESQYVFLQQNALEARWSALPRDSHAVFVIGETGFGTGLNFLLAWQLWERVAPPGARLVFRSLEAWPLETASLARALARWPELASCSAQLTANWPPLLPGLHSIELGAGRVSLQLFFGDVLDALREFGPAHPLAPVTTADAWFLDGFAPARNPAMWSDEVLRQIAVLSRPGTTLSTFSAAAPVRDALTAHGFTVRKIPGFGRKRDMISAHRDQRAAPMTPVARSTPWHIAMHPRTNERSALVIGAGIAGCTAALALARRGWEVSVLESADGPATGASQAMLFTQLALGDSAHAEFTLLGYLHALRFYRALLGDDATQRSACGMLQLYTTGKDQALLARLRQRYAALDRLVQFVDAAQASRLCGARVEHDGLFLPGSGWVAPNAARTRALAHPRIRTRFGVRVETLRRAGDGWLAGTDGQGDFTAAAVIIANSLAANSLLGPAAVPLTPVRGQITLVPRALILEAPHCVISGDGYVAPMLDGQLCCGASFEPHGSGHGATDSEHRDNLERLARLLPGNVVRDIAPADLAARVGLRATTPDRLPVAGPVPDAAACAAEFAALARNARKPIARLGSYQGGLYASIGHGSRGMTSAPLCAEMIAAHLCGEPAPVSDAISRALSPARFLLRGIVRSNAR
ncbi:MAG: bifunctional tRNA (5-methylaminomethyl-2-thiouridine)(34)-methyltransferase MnmD/FAD-dependent 5-carboxymethylaminomethyl-2-thiouridine(34) oxidoreductase MnmC [Gammaproteobacteria bacterium]|jgi:tRNA 5-methylaminomethyl-2-thiouridine biosynthesis bifunctional protein|nr:bifunctional tRNA (5-methylaminomethyl-2-thiouridine)(34)-methyltransferase MnmD/FAD-dependent 5-carboxymethylaminomethyl-2-thiouridine(34) oxidoreductase MnmC [Gammaproteobacteria bacterium]MBP6052214.1 bifunctional tRNA (5-methylaminomethyl-2-thiouridine)(34)-methyltransferase MnmD/FAD-dependent 5-carboxymethylaminomethyl-2-thiouridine(34) oxidoreductase MnmC [Pseudomonadales bacterium]MBK6581769.1 bifunctional tRNA (5-methylaminomethyl-2-thiouridine)(34)-methyltransferase MnmD/FAD-dependent